MKGGGVLLALALLACEPEGDELFGVIGDSTADFMLEQLHEGAAVLLEGTPRDHGDAVFALAVMPGAALGRDLAYFTRRTRSWLEIQPPKLHPRVVVDKVVVLLGTNDAGELTGLFETWPYVDTDQELAEKVDALLQAIPDVPVLWVLPGSPSTSEERKDHIRDGLEAARLRWPKLELLSQDPLWFAGGDGVHHSKDGEALAAAAIIRALEAMP